MIKWHLAVAKRGVGEIDDAVMDALHYNEMRISLTCLKRNDRNPERRQIVRVELITACAQPDSLNIIFHV